MAADDLSFEPLDVSIHSELLQKLFADNPLRSQQISHVFNEHQDSSNTLQLDLSSNKDRFTERSTLPVYRVGKFVEVPPSNSTYYYNIVFTENGYCAVK